MLLPPFSDIPAAEDPLEMPELDQLRGSLLISSGRWLDLTHGIFMRFSNGHIDLLNIYWAYNGNL